MNRIAVVVGVAEVLRGIALVVTTFTISVFADMAPAWRVLAVFMALEGANRHSDELSP